MGDASVTSAPIPTSIADVKRNWLVAGLVEIEEHTDKDVLLILGYLEQGLEIPVRLAVERLEGKRDRLLVILHTQGGSIEVVKHIVQTIRNFYGEVHFLVPAQAMSAGTVLVLSGDKIYMDYFSCLGPIDPQIIRNGNFVPALSYLRQYEALVEKGALSRADLVLLSKLDLAELDQIQLNAQLSVSLITDWLSRYKFKDWEREGKPVSREMREERASEVAHMLNDQEKWFVHGHRIHKNTLERDLKLTHSKELNATLRH